VTTTTQAGLPRARRGTAGSVLRLLDRPLSSYYLILGATMLLLTLGLVMVLSASSIEAYRSSGSVFSVVQKQAIWVGLGLPLMWLASRLPVSTYRAAAGPMLVVSLLLLALVLIPGVGREVNGNRNWIDFGGPFQLQPAEGAKLAIVLWGADLLTRKRKLLVQWSHLLVPLVPVAGAVVALVLSGGDLGTALVLLAILMGLLFFVGAPMRLFATLMVALTFLVVFMVQLEPYRVRRVTSFLDPFAEYHGSGWQGAQSIFALASGGLSGLGLGASREKWGYLPEAHTDFIFAIIGEELGLLGTLAVLLLFAALGYAGLRTARRNNDQFVMLAAAGTTTWVLAQALVNIGAVLGVLPITGIPLPLVSYGGSALLPTMVALGMLLSFAKREPGARAALAARGPGLARRPGSRPTWFRGR
jgi:cell division protein FtsW